MCEMWESEERGNGTGEKVSTRLHRGHEGSFTRVQCERATERIADERNRERPVIVAFFVLYFLLSHERSE